MAGNNSIQFLRGPSTKIVASDQVLSPGQPCFDLTTNELRVGHGDTIANTEPIVCRKLSAFTEPQSGNEAEVQATLTIQESSLQHKQFKGGVESAAYNLTLPQSNRTNAAPTKDGTIATSYLAKHSLAECAVGDNIGDLSIKVDPALLNTSYASNKPIITFNTINGTGYGLFVTSQYSGGSYVTKAGIGYLSSSGSYLVTAFDPFNSMAITSPSKDYLIIVSINDPQNLLRYFYTEIDGVAEFEVDCEANYNNIIELQQEDKNLQGSIDQLSQDLEDQEQRLTDRITKLQTDLQPSRYVAHLIRPSFSTSLTSTSIYLPAELLQSNNTSIINLTLKIDMTYSSSAPIQTSYITFPLSTIVTTTAESPHNKEVHCYGGSMGPGNGTTLTLQVYHSVGEYTWTTISTNTLYRDVFTIKHRLSNNVSGSALITPYIYYSSSIIAGSPYGYGYAA